MNGRKMRAIGKKSVAFLLGICCVLLLCGTAFAEKTDSFKVDFEGRESGLTISSSNDFFSNFGTLLPGDSMADAVTMENTSDHTANLFFHTELPSRDEFTSNTAFHQAEKLAKQLQLTISLDGIELYQGDLLAASLGERLFLQEIKPSQQGQLHFRVAVPKELGNDYTLNQAKCTWVFSVEQDDPVREESVPTGDRNKILVSAVFLGLSGGVLGFVIWRKNRKKRDGK